MRHRGTSEVGVAIALSLALVVTFGSSPAVAAAGDLDVAFGEGGLVTTVFPVGSFASAVAIQTDGKIETVGAAAGPSESGEFALAHYEEDGALDRSS